LVLVYQHKGCIAGVINITILINHLKKEEEGQVTVMAAPGGEERGV
jgi:hypothetical protein